MTAFKMATQTGKWIFKLLIDGFAWNSVPGGFLAREKWIFHWILKMPNIFKMAAEKWRKIRILARFTRVLSSVMKSKGAGLLNYPRLPKMALKFGKNTFIDGKFSERSSPLVENHNFVIFFTTTQDSPRGGGYASSPARASPSTQPARHIKRK